MSFHGIWCHIEYHAISSFHIVILSVLSPQIGAIILTYSSYLILFNHVMTAVESLRVLPRILGRSVICDCDLRTPRLSEFLASPAGLHFTLPRPRQFQHLRDMLPQATEVNLDLAPVYIRLNLRCSKPGPFLHTLSIIINHYHTYTTFQAIFYSEFLCSRC